MKLSEHRIERIALAVAIVVSTWPALHAVSLAWEEYQHPSRIVLADEWVTIELGGSEDLRQLLYESGQATVTIGYDQALLTLDTLIDEAENQDEVERYQESKTRFVGWTAGLEGSDLSSDAPFNVADALEMGHAIVYDKRRQRYVDTILMWQYVVMAPLGGSAHRYFYLPDGNPLIRALDMFWQVEDWSLYFTRSGIDPNWAEAVQEAYERSREEGCEPPIFFPCPQQVQTSYTANWHFFEESSPDLP